MNLLVLYDVGSSDTGEHVLLQMLRDVLPVRGVHRPNERSGSDRPLSCLHSYPSPCIVINACHLSPALHNGSHKCCGHIGISAFNITSSPCPPPTRLLLVFFLPFVVIAHRAAPRDFEVRRVPKLGRSLSASALRPSSLSLVKILIRLSDGSVHLKEDADHKEYHVGPKVGPKLVQSGTIVGPKMGPKVGPDLKLG